MTIVLNLKIQENQGILVWVSKGDPKTLTPGPWTNLRTGPLHRLGRKVILHISQWRFTKDHERPVCFEDREFHLRTVSPLPFCSAQSPAFAITNSTQASRKTARLVSPLVEAMDDR